MRDLNRIADAVAFILCSGLGTARMDEHGNYQYWILEHKEESQ